MFLFARCLHFLVKIFIKVKNGLMMNPGVKKRSICVWLLYCVITFCRFASPLISQLSGSQNLNYLPPRAKNSRESTTNPLSRSILASLLQYCWMHWEENKVRGEELDRYLDTSIRESQANKDI